MARPQHCDRAEWLRRAGCALAAFKPDLTAEQVASVVHDELWDEACHIAPEEAAEVYATEHPA